MLLHAIVGAWLLAGPAAAVAPGTPAAPEAPARPPAALQATAPQQPSVPPAARGVAEAYLQFLLGRSLESEGDVDGAIKAFREAARLDPKSAEIPAEMAALYARDNKLREALESAEQALKIDADNVEANRVLGFIYASLARVDDGSGPLDADSRAYAGRAVGYFEAARKNAEIPDPGLEMTLGRIYLRTGEPAKAIGVLGRLVVDEAGQPEPVNLLVQAYEQAGRSGDAIKLLEGIVVDQPQFHASLAELYERQQRWLLAAGSYEKALARNPRSLELRTRLAVALMSAGEPAQAGRAVTLLQQVRQDSPGDGRVLYLLAQALRVVGRLDESEATARELMTIAPGSVNGPYALALVLEQKQQFRQVADALEPVAARPPARGGTPGPELVPVLVHLGRAYVELGEFDRALATYDRARALSPGNTAIGLYAVQANLAARRFETAVGLARQQVAARPDDPQAVRLLADALRQTGRAAEGATLLADALKTGGDDASAYMALGEFYAQTAQYDAATRVLEDAARKFPSDLDIPFQIGSVYERQKRYADAERKFREVLARDPLQSQALNYLGYMLADRGERLDEAVGYIQRAVAAEPYNGAYLDSLGWAYFKQNRLDLAEPNLRRAAEQRIRDSAVQDHLGELLFKLGRYQEAAAAWQRALDGDGDQIDRAQLDRKLRSAKEKAGKQ
jgi:tetratricopeptide (TPR) repeat protein